MREPFTDWTGGPARTRPWIVIAAVALLALPSVALAADEGGYRLGFAQILSLFLVTLGPLKIVGPFGRLTRDLAPAVLRRLAVQSVLIGTLAVVGGGFLGSALAANWGVSTPILTICAGLIFFLVAMLFVRPLLHPVPAIALQLLGTVLGVLQVALALRILFVGLHDLDLSVKLMG